MNITPTILDPINADVRRMLEDAAAAHTETNRRAVVNLKLIIYRDKEGKRTLKARVQGTIPEGVDDSHTRKGDSVVLVSVGDDHPGQQRIGE